MNRAQQALDNVLNAPGSVVRSTTALLRDPTITADEAAVANWALGRALSELDRVDEACDALGTGITVADGAGLRELGAEIRVSLAACLLTRGESEEARRLLDRAAPQLSTDGALGRYAIQEGFLALHVGDFESALRHFSTADFHLRDGADELARTRLLLNRGVVHLMTGEPWAGERDFLEAQALATKLGQHMLAAGAAQNLGFGSGRKGDVPGALRWFATARKGYEQIGSPKRIVGLLDSDFATVLLSGGLYAESAAAAGRAANVAAQTGNRLAEAEAELLVARARLANRERAAAEHHAGAAAVIFRNSGREPWAAIAEYVGLQAAALEAEASNELLDRTIGIVAQLRSSGWLRESLEAQTFAGRTAVSLGRLDDARRLLGEVSARNDEASSGLRVTALLATATLQLADGNRHSAGDALSEAMTLVEEHRATLGSTELRAYDSINGAEVAELGLRLAVEDGRPDEVFHWAERWRAGSLQVAGIRPDPDSRLATALIELREAHSATIEGTTDPFDTDVDHRIGELEREIRELNRESGGTVDLLQRLDLGELQSALDGEVLIEYFALDGRLHAVMTTGSESAIHDLGPLSEVEQQLRRLTASLDRLAHSGSGGGREVGEAAIHRTARLLDDRLLGELGVPPGCGVIVVPTGPLQGMPWAVLPSLSDVAVTVTPSSWLWAGHRPAARSTVRSTDRAAASALLVCGPNLNGGRAEIERLAELYDRPLVLTGADATVAAVVEAMGNADIAHIAAHGSFRADNPMLSGLLLHDGPLTVYDLEALPDAPATVILPACNAARSSVHIGDELLGTAAALLQSGVRSVIAPLTVVPDTTITPDLMIELHTQLRAGRRPSEALVAARRAATTDPSPTARLVAMSFVAIDSRPRS